MFVALRDLRWARGRFALMGTVVALVALLMVLLTGLSTGLVDDNVSAIAELPASHLAFSAESGVKFNQSTVTAEQWREIQSAPGVEEATPVGSSLFNGHVHATAADAERARNEVLAAGKRTSAESKAAPAVDIALFGVEPGAFVLPETRTGEPISDAGDGVVISEDLARKRDVKVGDSIVLDRVGTVLPVIGISGKANFGHVPVVWAPLKTWQKAVFGARGAAAETATGEPATPPDVATFVALRGSAPSVPGLTVVTRTGAFAGSPGYSEETATLIMIQVFLYVIAAFLVASFFTVWTIQRTSEIGLLKALGARTSYVVRDAVAQAAVVLVAATAVGLLVGLGMGLIVPANAPFALKAGPVLLAAVLVVVMGLAGAAVSIRRITRIDPLIALTQGGAR